MPNRTTSFAIEDGASFDANLERFFETLEVDDAALATALRRELLRLLAGDTDRPGVLDALLEAASESEAQ